ncbi:bacterioferritin-associated ferredoxin [Aestuariibacter halophilus]|uniref:Bacterioferritin-associated ferredoxin n=1 Tax=Fluctibacter halophilus TaxID=226011 RepID=A0ABS8G717_9ALTE|nr:bacterioferritin-associated ferredoxin [Aestuariibacter halophilus]MCC2616203.1 bacterioferritin-associated ferredoxin [Aestuariibacter halophilus]
MYVCLCHGITDRAIKKAVTEQGVGSVRELKEQLGVGSQCGRCVQMAQQIIDTTIIDESLFKEVS